MPPHPKQEGQGLDVALYQVVARPFIFEHNGQCKEAIESYEKAKDVLDTLTTEHRSGMRKAVRKVLEHQAKTLGARKEYLSKLSRENRLEEVVLPPTVLGLNRVLEDDTTISHTQKTTGQRPPMNNKTIDFSLNATDRSSKPPLSASLPVPPSLAPPQSTFSTTPSFATEYHIDHKSELVFIGERMHYFFVRDPTSKQVHYVLRALWSNDTPIVEAVLSRAGELLPGAGAIHIDILKQPGSRGGFNLRMQSLSTGWVLEVPDRVQHRRDWTPRRFWYGGRLFVWKTGADNGTEKDTDTWETLYETTTRVVDVDGSKTGKKRDQVIGEKLCWGHRPTRRKMEARMYFRRGLDQGLVEHCLASQLAKWVRQANPPNKDTRGIEAAGQVTSMLSLVTELA